MLEDQGARHRRSKQARGAKGKRERERIAKEKGKRNEIEARVSAYYRTKTYTNSKEERKIYIGRVKK